MADKETPSSVLDISQLRTPIHISGKPVEQVLSSIHYGSPELRCLLMDECDLIFECKVCRALFRDLPNFISHKRVYCTKSSMENRHVTIASLPEEKVVIIQPQAPEETEKTTASTRQLRLQAKGQRPNLEETIMRIQSGELGQSHAYQVYTEAAEKLQRQKEGMKVATIRTTSIPTNKNAVFIDVNMTSVNIHERQQQSGVASYDQNRNDTSVTASKRKTGERHENTRNMRKSVKQEKHSSEPQKLLLEQLKEIQQKRVRSTPQTRDSPKNSTSAIVNESSQKPVVNTSQLKIQKKVSESAGLKMFNTDNAQSVLNKEEATVINGKNSEKAANSLVKHPVDSKNHPKTVDSKNHPKTVDSKIHPKTVDSKIHPKTADSKIHPKTVDSKAHPKTVDSKTHPKTVDIKIHTRTVDSKIHPKTVDKNQLHTLNAVTAVKTRKRFAEQSLICSKCSAVFATRKSMSFHNKIHHSTKRTFYPCPFCQSVFYYFYGITRHLFKNHDKTLEEVNAMRKQLREKSFTKPLCTPSLNSEARGIVTGSSRSTRTLVRNRLASPLRGVSSSKEGMSVLSDRQLSKKGSGGNEIIPFESPSKTAHQKSGQLSVPHGERYHNQQSLGVTADENIEEPRSVRVKNKQQQRTTESTGKSDSLSSLAHSNTGRVTATASQTRASTMTRLKENTSHICPKCRRSFRRKISCKNHIKVCNIVSRRSFKKMRPENRALKVKQNALEVTTPRRMKTPRVNRREQASSIGSGVKDEVTLGIEIVSGVKNSARKDVGAVANSQGVTSNILPNNSTDARNTKVSLENSGPSSSRRSSSMDRVTNHDEPRNRSHDRSSAGRDQRDSSVESTQSNIEGKSPRSRRNVLSRYATPIQPSKSPAKCDILVKTNTNGEVDSETNESEASQRVVASRKKLDLSGAGLSSDEEKTFNNGSEETSFELENESAIISEKHNINLPTVQDQAGTSLSMKSSGTNKQPDVLDCDDMSTTMIIQKSEKSSEILNSSHKNQELSPTKKENHLLSGSSSNICSSSDKHMIHDKQPGPTDRSLLFQIMSTGSLLKTEASSPESELVKDSSVLSNSSCEIKAVKCEFVNVGNETSQTHLKNDPWKLQKGVADLAGVEYQSVWENSEIFKDSMMEKGALAKKHKSVKLLEYDSKTDNLVGDFNKHHQGCLDIKVFESSSENSTLKNSSGNSVQNKNFKPQSLQEPAVVSALSERPKRKRKVPSRNRDAEEMLSKILGHSNQAAPGKRRKINPEPKTSVTSKQKLKSGDTINNTPSVTDLGRKDLIKINDTADVEKSKNEVEIIHDDNIPESDDEVDNEELGKVKGRFVSNRMYVLEKFGSKRKRLKCYDQVKVFKMIDEENLKCLECGELCTQVSNLRRHVIRQHLKWSRFKCKLCKFDSYDRSECTTHLIRGHRNLAINLRNVNRYIIDLVKKGSHARSIKKSQTIKVKQAQNQEENIYARPTVKKMLRLPQRIKDDSVPEKLQVSENSEDKNLDLQSQTRIKEQTLTPAQNLFEVKPGLIAQDPKPVAVVVTLSKKQINTLTASSKMITFPEQSAQQPVSKPGLVHQIEGKDASLKILRKSLPFNISTRNSPRTFDTRPYNPKNEGLSAASETTSASNEKYPLQATKEAHGKTVAPKTPQLKEFHNSDAGCLQKVDTIPRDVTKTDISVEKVTPANNTNADHDSKNIFDKMKIQTTSSLPSDIADHSSGNSDIVIKSVGSVSNEVYVTTSSIASEMSAPRVFEVKIKNPRHLLEKPKLFSQSPDSSIKLAPTIVDSSKTKVISYIVRGPQQKLTHVTDDVISPDLLAKSVIKVTKPLEQLSSLQPSAPCPEQIVKIASPGSRVTSYQVIDPTNLQRKQACISVPTSSTVKTPSLEHIKLLPQRSGSASKDLPGPSGMALAAALTKSGHISSTSASSFILSHGQAGKYIIYTRPAGAKELTTVGSLIKPMSVSSPVPSSSTTSSVTVVNSSVAKPDSEAQETAGEKAFLPETFVIRKHYL